MKGCLTIGVSYERVTAKSKAFVQEKFVLEPAYIRGVSLEGLGPMCLLGLRFFCISGLTYRIPKTAFPEGSLLLQVFPFGFLLTVIFPFFFG